MRFGMNRDGDILLMPKTYPEWHALQEWKRLFLEGDRSIVIEHPEDGADETFDIWDSSLSQPDTVISTVTETYAEMVDDAVLWIAATCKANPELLPPRWVSSYLAGKGGQ